MRERPTWEQHLKTIAQLIAVFCIHAFSSATITVIVLWVVLTGGAILVDSSWRPGGWTLLKIGIAVGVTIGLLELRLRWDSAADRLQVQRDQEKLKAEQRWRDEQRGKRR